MTDAVKGRIEALQSADTANKLPIPIDLVTVSASGLDPEISRQAAQYQASRVAKARKMSIDHVNQLIAANTQDRQWRIFGEPHVNVLKGGLMLMNIGPWNQKKCHHQYPKHRMNQVFLLFPNPYSLSISRCLDRLL